jgi:hypothetical protein
MITKPIKLWTEKDQGFNIQTYDGEIFFHLDPHNVSGIRDYYLDNGYEGGTSQKGRGVYGELIFECTLNRPIKCIAPFTVSKRGIDYADTLFEDIYKHEIGRQIKPWVNTNIKSSFERQDLINLLKKLNIDGWIAPHSWDIFDLEIMLINPKDFIDPVRVKEIKPSKVADTSHFGTIIKCIPPQRRNMFDLVTFKKQVEYRNPRKSEMWCKWTPFDHLIMSSSHRGL